MNDRITRTKEAAQDAHIEYIDVLRVVSMLSVVFLHTAAGSLRFNIGSLTWHISNFLTSAMSASVPVFFMISGAVILNSDKTLSISYLLKKRLPKAAAPFIVWSLVAVFYYGAVSYGKTGQVNVLAAINQIKNLPSKPAATHLWFMYALIPLYILSPILKKLMDSMTENLARYMFAVWAVFGALLPTAAFFARPGYRALFSLDPSYNLNIMNGYLGYFLFGYLFFKSDIRFSKRSLLCILTADTLFIALGTWLATTRIGQYTEMYKGYTRAFVFVLSIAAFLLAKEAFTGRRLSKKAGPAVKFLSAVSFGVYLVHNLLVNFISQKINLYPAGSVHVLFCCYFAALFVSIVFIVLLASIKPVCFLFTGLTYDFAGKSCNIPFLVKKIRGGGHGG